MNVIVICIYDREANLKHLFHCFKQCTLDAQIVVIHSDSDNGKRYHVPEGVIYLPRPNRGYDIGKFQDVCMNRMPGFPEWDKLLWITDDCWPMSKDFAKPFFDLLDKKDIGVACMEISPYVRQHIRTTGFAIRKETAQRLTFPADPVLSKEDCYKFEHRSLTHMLAQIHAMGLRGQMVAPQNISPLYDTGYHRRIRTREREHFALFGNEVQIPDWKRPARSSEVHTQHLRIPKAPIPEMTAAPILNPKVIFICPIFDKYPQIVSSLLCQTHQNWELHLIHDGPNELTLPDDPRIRYEKRERKEMDYGHSFRKEWIQKVNGDYLVITNPDNYHTPSYINSMLSGFKPGIVATYCENMVHSYTGWGVIPCRLKRGFIDCAGVMMKLEVAKEIGWNSTDHSADWFFFEEVIKNKGSNSFAKIPGCLLVHN